MRGASRASLTAAKQHLAAALAGASSAQATSMGDELFAVTRLLDREPGLRRGLSDPSRPNTAKTGLVQALFGGKVSDAMLGELAAMVQERWSEPGDLADAAEQLAVLAVADAADRQSRLDEVEDELFRFSRIVAGNPDLRAALSNQFVAGQGRASIVTELLAGKVTDETMRLVTQAAAYPRGRSLDTSLDVYAHLAAELRQRLIAEVHVAIALTVEQRARLIAALVAAYGHDIHLNIVLDPQVLGGMTVRIGDELINGSVASRLAELRRDLAA
jgi:F-type H+-transporting ATPase subunit delta